VEQLDGRRMRIEVRFMPWRVTLVASAGRLRLDRHDASAPDVLLTGTPMGLAALLREDPAAVIRRGDARLSGDAELGGRFQELFALLRPDLEAEAARIIGDIPAHGVGTLLRSMLGFARSSVATQARNVGEYLAHERQVLVPQAEGRPFLEGVDALRESTDRLAARVARLETRGSGS
jgi:ubiquinone biosynthesis protein UbiJ